MADWIVTPNLITVNTADTIAGWFNAGSSLNVALASETDINTQGAACVSWGTKNAGPYYFYCTNSASPTAVVDGRNQHMYIWFYTSVLRSIQPYANGGIGIMLGTGAAAWNINTTAIWVMDGQDTFPGSWKCYVLDLNSQPDFSGSSWTSSAIQNIHKWGIFVSQSAAAAKANPNVYIDVVRYGSGLTIYSGSSTDPANFEALYQSDYTASNKYGVIDKRGGVYFLQGNLTIGSQSVSTYFQDAAQIVEYEPKYVSASFYRLDITGSGTTCSLGGVVGSGASSIGIQQVTIRGSQDFKRIKPAIPSTGPAAFTQSLRPTIFIAPDVKRISSYATRFDTVGDVNIGVSGSSGTGVDASNMIFVDNTWAATKPLFRNIAANFSLSLNNKMVSTTQSYIPPSASYAIMLFNTGTIDSGEFSVFNSYGFTSPPNSITASRTLSNQFFTSNQRYITIYGNKTWNVINPTWETPTTKSLFFTVSQSNYVNELYSLTAYTGTPTGTAITSSSVYVYEGTLSQSIVNRGYTDSTGSMYSNILKTTYIASGSIASPQFLASHSYGNFALKAYKYGYTPYLASNTVTAPINSTIALVSDSAITEPDQHVAMTLSSSVTVKKRTIPVAVIGYVSGSAGFTSGSGVTGSISNATGYVVEYIGTTEAGAVVLDRRNGAPFVEYDILQVGTTPYATASLSSSNGGFSGSYTWIVDCNSNALTGVYDYLAAEMAAWPISSSFEQVLTWGQNQQTQLMYAGGSGYYTNRNTSLNQGVWIAKKGLGTLAYLTSDGGNLYYPPVQYTLTLTGLVAGTEVRIYKKADMTEIAGVESSGTTFTYTYTYTGDVLSYIMIVSLDYEIIMIDDYTITNANASIPIQQRLDRNYRNPPP